MKNLKIVFVTCCVLLFAANMATAQSVHHQRHHRYKTVKQQPVVERRGKPALIQKHQPRVVSRQSSKRIQLQLMQARKHEMEQAKVDKAQKEAAKDQKIVH